MFRSRILKSVSHLPRSLKVPTAKPSNFDGIRCLYTIESHLPKMVSPISFSNHTNPSKISHLPKMACPISFCNRTNPSKISHLPKMVSPISFCNRTNPSRISHLPKLVSLISFSNHTNPSKISFLRGLCSETTTSDQWHHFKYKRVMAEAQAALLDYLHGTRELHFPDAEYISKNSPIFLIKIMKKIGVEEECGTPLRWFFQYHPINEFEPFFESMGLEASEYEPLLRRDMMFLSDDPPMLENYRVLCNYDIARNKIGKMYKDGAEIFRYEKGVLDSKLRAYEEVGLSKCGIVKIVTSDSSLLIGDVNPEVVKVLEELEDLGIERDWIGGHLSEKLYDWSKMLMTMQFFTDLGFTKNELGTLIRRHPDFLLDGSGMMVFSIAGLLLKLGRTRSEIINLFSEFPNVPVVHFRRNLLQSLQFLIEIHMESEDIRNIFRTHLEVLSSCYVKKTNSILKYLNVGTTRLCQIIKENPHQLEKFVFGVKISPLPDPGQAERRLLEKRKFLLRVGFADNSEEMKKALVVFRGKGDELQERYDFLVKSGLHPHDVSCMLKKAPQILNNKLDVLERKIDFLVNDLGHPLSTLLSFPAYISYSLERVKCRLLMYSWLKDRGITTQSLSLSHIVVCSDKRFEEMYVNRNPEGLVVWENLKKGLPLS